MKLSGFVAEKKRRTNRMAEAAITNKDRVVTPRSGSALYRNAAGPTSYRLPFPGDYCHFHRLRFPVASPRNRSEQSGSPAQGTRRIIKTLNRVRIRAPRDAGHMLEEIAATVGVAKRSVQSTLKEPPNKTPEPASTPGSW